MSFNSHRRMLLDKSQSFSHRALRARSCALLVSRKLGVERGILIELVQSKTGVDLHAPQSSGELLIALEELTSMRIAQ